MTSINRLAKSSLFLFLWPLHSDILTWPLMYPMYILLWQKRHVKLQWVCGHSLFHVIYLANIKRQLLFNADDAPCWVGMTNKTQIGLRHKGSRWTDASIKCKTGHTVLRKKQREREREREVVSGLIPFIGGLFQNPKSWVLQQAEFWNWSRTLFQVALQNTQLIRSKIKNIYIFFLQLLLLQGEWEVDGKGCKSVRRNNKMVLSLQLASSKNINTSIKWNFTHTHRVSKGEALFSASAVISREKQKMSLKRTAWNVRGKLCN